MHRLLTPLLFIALWGTAHADTIRIPVGQQGQEHLATPSRGDSKALVLDRFGLADLEHSAVGHPPITRWDYRHFSVYFEADRVVNSVLHHDRTALTQRDIQ